MRKPLNIGMIGYGFMGRAHSNAYRKVNNFFDLEYQPVLKAVCARNAAKAKAFADTWGYESVETDWRKLVARKDIDAVDICAPNNLHPEIAIAAAKAGKMILCEKPLAMNTAEGEEMVDGRREGRRAEHGLVQLPPRAGRHAGQAAHRRRPARAASSTTAPTSCRTGRSPPTCRRAAPACGGSTSSAAGSGVTGDLLAHCIDTALWLNGPITSVTAMTETFIKERKHTLTGKVEPVGIDDACAFLCRFANGSLGHLRIDPLRPRPQGALHVRDQRRERLDRLGPARPAPPAATSTTATSAIVRGWRSIHVTDGDHPYMEQLVGAGPADRLRAHVRPPGGRLPRRPGQEASPPRPPSATPSKPKKSATPCLASAKSRPMGACSSVAWCLAGLILAQGKASSTDHRRRSLQYSCEPTRRAWTMRK